MFAKTGVILQIFHRKASEKVSILTCTKKESLRAEYFYTFPRDTNLLHTS